MRAYLAIGSREPGAPIPQFVLDAARRAAIEAVPVPADRVRSAEWVASDAGIALLAWSNEPDHDLLPSALLEGAGRVLGYCGYLGDPRVDERLLQETADLRGATEELGGVFSVFRVEPTRIEAATSITRVCPVYYAENARITVVGSRALLVHLTARAAETRMVCPDVDIDVPELQPMVRHGFFPNNETPFRGVRALPNASVLVARRGEPVRVSQIPFPVAAEMPRGTRAVEQRVTRLAEALLASAKPLARHKAPVTLALTGGRDSRLMAAVLTAAGIHVRAYTHGFADDPDVVLGAEVASTLGIEHEIRLTEPGGRAESVTVQHPFLRAHHIVRMCEGMTSAYENVNQEEPYTVEPRTSGSGGETLRGGFLYDQNDVSAQGLQKRIRTVFCAADRFMTLEANELARRHYQEWAQRAHESGFDVLDKLYLFYRTGRWIVGSHTATLMNWTYYHPFFDNRVVREALTLPAEWRRSEEPFFQLIQTLAPSLANIRLEGKRWRFERERPRRITQRRSWRARAALQPVGRTSGFNWRKQYGENFQKIMREQILEGPHELFSIVDEKAVKELLSNIPPTWPNQVWNMYTLSLLLSGSWREPPPQGLPNVAIPLPAPKAD